MVWDGSDMNRVYLSEQENITFSQGVNFTKLDDQQRKLDKIALLLNIHK